MINWREIRLEDKAKIDDLICASGCHGADYSFANLYMWRNAYNPLFAFVGERLVVYMPNLEMYSYPKGGGDIRPSIDALLEEAHSKGNKLLMRGLTEKTLAEFMPIYGERFDVEEDRDNADYIYTADHLCNLPGRKMSSKRNHINRFLKNGDWELVKVTQENFGEARDFIDLFYKVKDNPELEAEAGAIDDMFKHFDELGFRAALLYQNGKVVAFSAGTRLDTEVFDVHFEKALPDVEGAYTMINREFARMIADEFPEIEAFNREEDMGIDGLRKAKLSYHPDLLLMKYYVREK